MNARTSDLRSAQDLVYEHLRAAILSLQFRPGERLRAQDVASKLNVSRTPVREALGRLEQEGLVQRDGGWGYALPRITLKEAVDFYKVREILEVAAAADAAGRLNAYQAGELAKVLDAAERALNKGELDAFRRHIRGFRHILASVVDNECLLNLLSSIDDRVYLFSAMLFDRHAERAREVLSDYRRTLKALKAGDVRGTQRAVRQHIRASKEALMNYVLTASPDGRMRA